MLERDVSWLTVTWSMCAAVCWTVAIFHVALAMLDHRRRVNSLVAVMALGAGMVAMTELMIMQTSTVSEFRLISHFQHFGLALLLVPMPWYVVFHFGAGRRWMAWIGSGAWVVALVLDLVLSNGLTYTSIDSLEQKTTFWGESFTVVNGERNPFSAVADVGVLLILAYVLISTWTLWRSGGRRQSVTVGISIGFFFVAAMAHVPLVDFGVLKMPTLIAPLFLSVIAAISLELVFEVLASATLSRQVKANEARWRNLLNNIQLLVVGVDAGGKLNYANPHMEEVSGFTTDELVGGSFEVTIPEEDVDGVRGLFVQAMQGNMGQQVEMRLRTKAGETRTVNWTTILQRDESQSVTGFLSVGIDDTDRQLAEQTVRETRRELERTGRLNVLGEVAASLAHELNQPLTAILSNAQAAKRFLARQPPDYSEINAILEDIVRDDKRAGEVIHGLRAMLKKEPGVSGLIDLNTLTKETYDLLRHELEARHVNVELQLDSAETMTRGVRVELQQVLMNLIINAAQAMAGYSEENRRLKLVSRRDEQTVHVMVSDSGPGIEPGRTVEVFEPFVTTREEGLGMGLTICRRIVESHGGKIEVKNHDDKSSGAVFSVNLPREECE